MLSASLLAAPAMAPGPRGCLSGGSLLRPMACGGRSLLLLHPAAALGGGARGLGGGSSLLHQEQAAAAAPGGWSSLLPASLRTAGRKNLAVRSTAGWMDKNDSSVVTFSEVLEWCIADALRQLLETPPAPLGLHNPKEIIEEYKRLRECNRLGALEGFSATSAFLKLQWKQWQMYGAIVKGYPGGPEEVIFESGRRSCLRTPAGEVDPSLLETFGLREENMPSLRQDHDYVAALLYSAKETRNAVAEFKNQVHEHMQEEAKKKLEKARKEKEEKEKMRRVEEDEGRVTLHDAQDEAEKESAGGSGSNDEPAAGTSADEDEDDGNIAAGGV